MVPEEGGGEVTLFLARPCGLRKILAVGLSPGLIYCLKPVWNYKIKVANYLQNAESRNANFKTREKILAHFGKEGVKIFWKLKYDQLMT